jgi:hypothetical protein
LVLCGILARRRRRTSMDRLERCHVSYKYRNAGERLAERMHHRSQGCNTSKRGTQRVKAKVSHRQNQSAQLSLPVRYTSTNLISFYLGLLPPSMSLGLYVSLRIGAILEKRAPPTVRAMPKLGESITFWWRHRLVRLNREIRENQHEFMQQWITCR